MYFTNQCAQLQDPFMGSACSLLLFALLLLLLLDTATASTTQWLEFSVEILQCSGAKHDC
jgi:hypothetical protein